MKILPVLVFSALSGAAICNSYSSVVALPTASITVGSGETQITIPVDIVAAEKGYGFSINLQTAAYTISGSGLLNPDPMITYSFAAADLLPTPLSFTFNASVPIVPTGPNTTVSASLSGGLTDGGDGSVSVTPLTGTELQKSFGNLSTSLGDDVGPAFTAGSGSSTYGPYSAGPMPGPSGTFTTLSVALGFTLSAQDAVGFSGQTIINTSVTSAPEGAPGLMGALALVGTLAAGVTTRSRALR